MAPGLPPEGAPREGNTILENLQKPLGKQRFWLSTKLLICRHGAAVARRSLSGPEVPIPKLAGGIIPKSLFESKQVKTTRSGKRRG